jgi:shikimate kinase
VAVTHLVVLGLMGSGKTSIARQLAEREPRIVPLAAVVIDVSAVDKDDAADLIVRLVAAAEPSAP